MQKRVSDAEQSSVQVGDLLLRSLAETSVATLKAQNFHWNVEGMAFGPLHALFQEIYEDHFEAQDALAERMRSLELKIDASYATFLRLSQIDEAVWSSDGREMISVLLADQEQLSNTLRSLAQLADDRVDLVTNDLAIQRAFVHDKFAWMLRSHLKS